jgi:hypothetical protein
MLPAAFVVSASSDAQAGMGEFPLRRDSPEHERIFFVVESMRTFKGRFVVVAERLFENSLPPMAASGSRTLMAR